MGSFILPVRIDRQGTDIDAEPFMDRSLNEAFTAKPILTFITEWENLEQATWGSRGTAECKERSRWIAHMHRASQDGMSFLFLSLELISCVACINDSRTLPARDWCQWYENSCSAFLKSISHSKVEIWPHFCMITNYFATLSHGITCKQDHPAARWSQYAQHQQPSWLELINRIAHDSQTQPRNQLAAILLSHTKLSLWGQMGCRRRTKETVKVRSKAELMYAADNNNATKKFNWAIAVGLAQIAAYSCHFASKAWGS